VPAALAALTLTLPTRCGSGVRRVRAYPSSIACVIVEPVAGNMNCVPPAPGFLAALSEQCREHGALLIFDEVMTGFRVANGRRPGAVRDHAGPDHLGKIIGGGCRWVPSAAGATVSRRSRLGARVPGRHLAGTRSHGRGPRHAGHLEQRTSTRHSERKTRMLAEGWRAAREAGTLVYNMVCVMFRPVLSRDQVGNYAQVGSGCGSLPALLSTAARRGCIRAFRLSRRASSPRPNEADIDGPCARPWVWGGLRADDINGISGTI